MTGPERAARSGRPRVALATSADWKDLAPDDRVIAPALARAGVDSEIAVWTDDRRDWERFDAILVRSCWNYHDDLPRWLDWIAKIEGPGRNGGGAQPQLLNAPSVLRWNARKLYLADLVGRGIAVVPTLWLAETELASWSALEAALQACAWQEVILKPAVSAGALLTYRLRPRDLGASRVALTAALPELARRGPVLVQPYLREIADEGEWSLLFFDGDPSHAVVKRPAAGDYRVQEKHGGSTVAATPSGQLLRFCEDVLAAAADAVSTLHGSPLPRPFVYARVDLVLAGGRPLLMELELTEPALFLQSGGAPPVAASPVAASPVARLAAAIARRI